MKRRRFLVSSLAAAAIPGSVTLAAQQGSSARELIEIRKYHLHYGAKKNLVSDFYKDVAIAALNRLGIDRVGVFSGQYGVDSNTLHIIIPYPSFEVFLKAPDRLLSDSDYASAGADFLNRPLFDSAYARFENSLLLSFSEIPKLEVPIESVPSRIFEMRTYASHSRKFAKKKVEMFNEGGEIAIFRETGLQPVFFGETIVGQNMPNLIYMLAFANMETRDANWQRFVNSDGWQKLRADPQYTDTVSNINDVILRPTDFSQI
jgi:hypothetical protein